MSATVNEEIATALFAAYREGWHCYCAAFGATDQVVSLIASDASDIMAASLIPDAAGFRAAFDVTRAAICQRIAEQQPLRRLIVAEDPFWSDWPSAIREAAYALHEDLAVRLDGLPVAVGLVRLSRISSCITLFRALANSQPRPGVMMRLMCLHSHFPFAGRFAREALLKDMLTRKGGPGQEELGLRSALVRLGILEEAHKGGYSSVLILVVSSPVIETGNDLDFDFGIVEPSSTRAIVQTAGRVFRHRQSAPDQPNIVVLPSTIAGLSDAGRGAAYRWPGVESPQAEGIDRIVLPSVRVADLLAISRLQSGIDARMILSEEAARDVLVAAERELERRYLAENAIYGPHRFACSEKQRFDGMFPVKRRFRRTDQETICLFMTTDATWSREEGWNGRFEERDVAIHVATSATPAYAMHVAPLTSVDPLDVARTLAPLIPGSLTLQNDLLLGCDIPEYLMDRGIVYNLQTGFHPRHHDGDEI